MFTSNKDKMEIKTKESIPVIKTTLKTCEICKSSKALYKCPRCNISYCNLKCYQDQTKHINCSESFYQDQVTEELKNFKLDDTEERNRMVRILKKNIKELEKENILPEEEDGSTSEDDGDLNEKEIDEEQLIKAYQTEIKNWTPWWRSVNEASFIEIPDLSKLNSKLVKNAQKINISTASPLISDDLIQLFYIYSAIATVYQLESDQQSNFNEEIVLNILQIDKLCKNSILQQTRLETKINLTFKLLLEDQLLFLRDYINKSFLISLLDENKFLSNSPMVVYKLISTLYDSFEIFTRSNSLTKRIPQLNNETEVKEDEKPINVFHFNKEVDKKVPESGRKSRVQIIYQRPTSKLVENSLEKSADSLREAKMLQKRLEFYFKWFQMKQIEFKNSLQSFDLIKELLVKEYHQFDEQQEFMQKNLNKLRAHVKKSNNRVLIEEV